LPLFERARVEVYLPDLPRVAYYNLLDELTQEFTYAFGGCTIIHGLDGSYLSEAGSPIQDRINLVYTDTPYAFVENFETISNCSIASLMRLAKTSLILSRRSWKSSAS
jgi:hypothetical protein